MTIETSQGRDPNVDKSQFACGLVRYCSFEARLFEATNDLTEDPRLDILMMTWKTII
jgi:hypothetical protein